MAARMGVRAAFFAISSRGGQGSVETAAACQVHHGLSRAEQRQYTRDLPEIYRRFTGGTPEQHAYPALTARSPHVNVTPTPGKRGRPKQLPKTFPFVTVGAHEQALLHHDGY